MENIRNSSNSTDSGIVQVTQSNIDSVLAASELVIMVLYNERSRYSTRLLSIFHRVATEITQAGFGRDKVVIAKVDSGEEKAIETRFEFYMSYSAIKLFRNGLPSDNCCKCKHTVQGIVEFIKEQLSDPIITISHLNELHDLNEEKGHVIAYLNSRDQPEYDVLRKVATSLKNDFQFYVTFGESAQQKFTGHLSIVFRSTGGTTVELDDKYDGSLLSFGDICTWVQQRAFPLLREFTCDNEDKLRRKGQPFVILIHMPSDTEIVKKYKEDIRKELKSERRLQFLTADGIKFQQLLLRFDKSKSDLPLLAFDQYRRIALFEYNIMLNPEKLKELINDLRTGMFYLRGIYLWRLFSSDTEYDISGLFE